MTITMPARKDTAIAVMNSGCNDLSCVCLAALLSVMAVPQAAGQCQYDVTIIPPGPDCPPWISPTGLGGLNEAGDVVGTTIICTFTAHAIFWSPETGVEFLAFSPGTGDSWASDLTESGQIVGTMIRLDADPPGERGFVHDGQQATDLGTLPGGSFSQAISINEQGYVVGVWGSVQSGKAPPIEAFIWNDGVMTGLGPDLGTATSWAVDINEAGQVTGLVSESGGTFDGNAYVWQDGVVTVLPQIPGAYMSTGSGINNHGDVTGWAKVINPQTGAVENRGFVWIDGQMTILEPLPGFVRAAGTQINDSRQVVGVSWSSNAIRGFIWQNGVQTELNDLIPEAAGVRFDGPSSINNAGQIAGGGRSELLQMRVGLLLTPVDVPPGDLDGDCRVGITDFLDLLANWGVCPAAQDCPADLNGDGVVDGFDFMILLVNWG